ncbi:hypothetical protein EK904_008979 [Melospiza melodia maxima]|nr:hypothetical protein EK904_008979 [Melospiza melodia maxima]
MFQLQGSIKRKLEDDSSPASSGVPDVTFPNDSKRLCLDDVNLAMGQGANPSMACPEMQSSPFPTGHSTSSLGVTGHPVLLENNHMNGGGIGSPFSVPANTEINQKGSIGGQTNNIVHYDEKGNSLQSVDQELQDLLEELTKMPDPSPNDLDLEKILCSKAEDPLGLSHSQPNINTTPKSSPQTSHLENHVANKDFSPGCNPTSGGSPQMRPSSAGANFQVPPSNKPAASPISTAAQNKNQPPPMLPVPLPSMPGSNWHAQQLKQLAASKQVSGTKQQVQAPSWPTMSPPGVSPPYRAGSSPHHQPFSPQNVMVSGMPANNLPGNNIQSPQNTLLSSMTSSSTPSNGPSPPYGSEKLSSPALSQQPFSPQSSMLPALTAASLPASSIKSPQNNLVASMASTNTGPSPPYRPEKLSSPALHQQPFSPQGTIISNITPTSNPTNMQNSLFKSMTTNQTKNMNIIMQQPSSSLQPGLVNESPVSQDQFSFNNTKPLSHFASESATQKMSPLTAGQGQQSLIHYLQQQQQQQQQSPATQQPQQNSTSQFLQQQFRQLMQPHRMQRQMQAATLPSQSRQDPLLFSKLCSLRSPFLQQGRTGASLGLCGTGNREAYLVLFGGLPVKGLLFNKDLEQFVAPGTRGPCLFGGTQVKQRVENVAGWGSWLRLKGSKVQQFHELLPTRCFTLEADFLFWNVQYTGPSSAFSNADTTPQFRKAALSVPAVQEQTDTGLRAGQGGIPSSPRAGKAAAR